MKETKANDCPASRPAGWLVYDDSCGFCRGWVLFWGNSLRKRDFDLAPLQAGWVRERLNLTEPDLLRDIRLLLSDGRVIHGADVYRFLMRRIWWAYPIYLLSVTPLLRGAFDLGYRTFANHRHGISRSCGPSGREKGQP